jgi:hypothetical protein
MEPVFFEVNAIAAGIPAVIIVIAFEIISDKHLEKLDDEAVYSMTAYSVILTLGLYGLFFVFGKVISSWELIYSIIIGIWGGFLWTSARLIRIARHRNKS